MVEFEELAASSVSKERLLDAQAIEEAAASMTRVSAKIHLEALGLRLRKEGQALKRVEASQAKVDAEKEDMPPPLERMPPPPERKPPAQPENPDKEKKPPVSLPAAPPVLTRDAKYVPIDKFAFDFGDYNSAFVTIYVTLISVGSIPKEQISCMFDASSFDLIVRDLAGKSYRLLRSDLSHNILPEKSKYIVKANKIVMKLAKIKGEYGSYDHWTDLTDKKKKNKEKTKKDPTAGLMDMMKDMYEDGDDNMKKMIGETMLKQREGQLGGGGGMDSMDDDGYGKMGVGMGETLR